MKARAFFYVCAGVFLLALSYHLGARTAMAQAPANPVVAMNGSVFAVTANGDVYREEAGDGSRWTLRGNVFATPTPTQHESLGSVKARYR